MYTDDPGPQEIGSFCRYLGTNYVQQKKQYNQTIKPQENPIVWFLSFFRDDGTCRKTRKIWPKSTKIFVAVVMWLLDVFASESLLSPF